MVFEVPEEGFLDGTPSLGPKNFPKHRFVQEEIAKICAVFRTLVFEVRKGGPAWARKPTKTLVLIKKSSGSKTLVFEVPEGGARAPKPSKT